MSIHPVILIIDTVGVDTMKRRLGIGEHAIRSARNLKLFPGIWFDELETMCREAGVPCPRDAFNWRRGVGKSRIPDATAPATPAVQGRQSVSKGGAV